MVEAPDPLPKMDGPCPIVLATRAATKVPGPRKLNRRVALSGRPEPIASAARPGRPAGPVAAALAVQQDAPVVVVTARVVRLTLVAAALAGPVRAVDQEEAGTRAPVVARAAAVRMVDPAGVADRSPAAVRQTAVALRHGPQPPPSDSDGWPRGTVTATPCWRASPPSNKLSPNNYCAGVCRRYGPLCISNGNALVKKAGPSRPPRACSLLPRGSYRA